MQTVTLKKMLTTLTENKVSYAFGSPSGPIAITGQSQVRIKDTGRRLCVSCDRLVPKLFGQGFCYPCFKNSPDNAECIIRPELCRAHIGEGRDPEWEERNHNQPHCVYLANSGGLKVGVTRTTQIPTRWMDQGACAAIVLATTPNRYLAGVIEVEMKQFFNDKTNWQKMLKGLDPELDLADVHQKTQSLTRPEWHDYIHPEGTIQTVKYPVTRYPDTIKSTKLDNFPTITGILMGIRGQYLIFDDNRVLNVRNHSGYEVELTIS